MANFKLHLRYIYTFYSFDEIMLEDAFDQQIEVGNGLRFTLTHQSDASFTVSCPKSDFLGNYVILTFPNKDNLIVREGEECELSYDEYNDDMGANNHNVYEGTVTLERCDV